MKEGRIKWTVWNKVIGKQTYHQKYKMSVYVSCCVYVRSSVNSRQYWCSPQNSSCLQSEWSSHIHVPVIMLVFSEQLGELNYWQGVFVNQTLCMCVAIYSKVVRKTFMNSSPFFHWAQEPTLGTAWRIVQDSGDEPNVQGKELSPIKGNNQKSRVLRSCNREFFFFYQEFRICKQMCNIVLVFQS